MVPRTFLGQRDQSMSPPLPCGPIHFDIPKCPFATRKEIERVLLVTPYTGYVLLSALSRE